MGILNVTPDSFSGDGLMEGDLMMARAREMVEAGVDVLDVGGESTAYWRADYQPVSAEEELRWLWLACIAAVPSLHDLLAWH